MNNNETSNPPPGNLSYQGNNAYGYGPYGYGTSQEEQQSFNLADLLFVIRERFLLIFVIFALTFAAVVAYTFTRPEMYRASASVEILRTPTRAVQVDEVVEQRVSGAEDFNTQISIFESGTIARRVADRLSENQRNTLMGPHRGDGDIASPVAVLMSNRTIQPLRQRLIVVVQFQHQDPQLAADIANLYVEEFIAHKREARFRETFSAVEELEEEARRQRARVEQLENRLADFHEEIGTISLDERYDIVSDRLRSLNQSATDLEQELQVRQNRLEQIQEITEANGGFRQLMELPFIANNYNVSELNTKRVSASITVNQLSERYGPRHPEMIQARRNLRETEEELQKAVQETVENLRSEYETTQRNFLSVQGSLQRQEEEIIRLSRIGVEYRNILRDKQDAETLYNSLLSRISETRLITQVEPVNVVPLDQASAPLNPFSPRIFLFLGVGALGGLGLGLGLAFFVALIDDRVKSAYDIESVLGLSLLGIIPEAKKVKGEAERTHLAISNKDPMTAEALRSLHSSLKFHKLTSTAQVILTTSILPNEGKTFVSSNLALTYAFTGEKTLLIDGDLRNPSIAADMGLTNDVGLTDYCIGNSSVEDIINVNVEENLDVITSGQQRKKPSQILHSEEFAELMQALRKRYKRIIIDSPPLGPVRDSLSILPQTDGVMFVIRFGEAKRKEAKKIIHELFDSEIPIFGAVLNGVDPSVSGYYNNQYYRSSYRSYYIAPEGKENS
ncbi:MAG: polysaccharide biosynthesis tyrosine autokinase [Opitutales bacterium]|nr:polysaccharide biosynthesis tyrosine autokinase [Opitutales bacterium]MCH8540730.1 polysaccharide biosynthesis tyrosine autokinase [Opitutales bacterium]